MSRLRNLEKTLLLEALRDHRKFRHRRAYMGRVNIFGFITRSPDFLDEIYDDDSFGTLYQRSSGFRDAVARITDAASVLADMGLVEPLGNRPREIIITAEGLIEAQRITD